MRSTVLVIINDTQKDTVMRVMLPGHAACLYHDKRKYGTIKCFWNMGQILICFRVGACPRRRYVTG